MKNILVTGVAGFIGFHLCKRLLEDGHRVVGIDNINNYYDEQIKKDRLELLYTYKSFKFEYEDICNKPVMDSIFDDSDFDVVVNLAAQAGVRYSIEKPEAYIESNLIGFFNILENCRQHNIKHFVFASSASVYGLNTAMPFSEHHNVDHPMSLYGATKRANELMAHSYSHLYNLPCTGLRFFSVFGPWGRPDLALFIFVSAMTKGKSIDIFNHGEMERDMTYVDDTVEGIVRIMNKIPEPDPDWDTNNPDPPSSNCPYRVYNIGNNNPIKLLDFVNLIEDKLGITAKKNFMDMQLGDISSSRASSDDLKKAVGFKPSISVKEGVSRFIDWYKEYYRVQ